MLHRWRMLALLAVVALASAATVASADPGHGKSGAGTTPYSMERFGKDVLAILDDLNIEKTHWCGLSMGGMVGQWLGANAPKRFDRMILSNTACYYPDPTNWHNRIKAVKEGGLASIADGVMTSCIVPKPVM